MFGEPQVASCFATEPQAASYFAHDGAMEAAGGTSEGGISDRLKQMQSMSADEMKQKIQGTKEQERLAAERLAANEAKRRAAIADGLAKAKAFFASGYYERAEAAFTRVLDENPDNRVEIVCNRAACSLKLGAFSDAVSDAAEAACMDPTYVKAQYRLALGLQGLGKLDRAIKVCREGLALQPESPQLLKLLENLEEAAGLEPTPAEPSSPSPSLPPPPPPPAPPAPQIEVRPGVFVTEAGARSLADLAEGRAKNGCPREVA